MPNLKIKRHWRKLAQKAPERRYIARSVLDENVFVMCDLSVDSDLIFAQSLRAHIASRIAAKQKHQVRLNPHSNAHFDL